MTTASISTESGIAMKKLTLACLVAAAVSGCASVQPNAGFDEVQNAVATRTGKQVQWLTGGTEDQEVAQKLRELLSQELNVEQAVQIALLNNQQLQATYQNLGISQAALVQAGLIRNPVFNGAVLFPLDGARPELGLGIAQDFLSLLYLPLNRRFAENQFEAVKLQVTNAVLALAQEVRAEFYRAQAANQMLDLFEEVVKNTSASFVAAKRLREAGNITNLALHQEQVLYEESRLALAAAEAELVVARERLNVLMGLWGNEAGWKISPRLPDSLSEVVEVADLETRAIAANLDLAARRQLLSATATRLGFTNFSRLIPSLEAGIEAEREEDWELGPSIGLPIPIFDTGRARIAAARAELRQAQAEYAAAGVQVRAAVRASYAALVSTRDRALFVRDVYLPLKNRIVEETLLQYNAMQIGVFQLLFAQREQIGAARLYIETLRDYWIARNNLQQTLAGGPAIMPAESIVEQPGTMQTGAEAGGAQPGAISTGPN